MTSYSQWGAEQPDASMVDHSCVTLHPKDGLWYTRQCDDLRPAICRVTNGMLQGLGEVCEILKMIDLEQ